MDNPKEILKKCKSGDRAAQNQLYRLMYKELLCVPLRYLSNREEANGIFNQGMLKIFQSIDQAEKVKNLMGWAYTIIHRTTIDHLRKVTNYRKKHFTVADYNVVESNNSINSVMDQLEVDDIFKIIQELPQAERTVFSLYEIDGYKHKEIGTMLDISESHSKYLLHHAKKKLRERLNTSFSNLKNEKHGL